jgi:hypothetical protein
MDEIAAYGAVSIENVRYMLLFYDKVAFTLNPASLVSPGCGSPAQGLFPAQYRCETCVE